MRLVKVLRVQVKPSNQLIRQNGNQIRNYSKWKYANVHASPNPKKETIDSIIRVDHAGEFGAQQIYNGQLAVFKGTSLEHVIKVINLS
jgi:demethoxyubiquinone hydroxylase (CLK1/Coq7/Cat5 family)